MGICDFSNGKIDNTIHEPPTMNPLNTRFTPSEVLFTKFKKQYKIEDKPIYD